jgi:DNA (cytosine-5)-methyltransferase 1
MDQIDLFSTNLIDIDKNYFKPFKIDKPIRLIELFGGIGSQAMALRNIGANFEHYRLVEYDKYPVASYNMIHNTHFEPTDITKINADYLGIVDTDKYEYIMTYSFPCQDLSSAGKQKGMHKGSGTRSGLLWEVERLLNECENLPQILLMENVPQVIGTKNIRDFQQWELFLASKGYQNYVQVLNAKDYGIPQNRKRCFMISLLGDYSYEFPKKQELKLKLKDMLEDEVDESFYLSDGKIQKTAHWKSFQKPFEKVQGIESVVPTLTARGAGEEHSGMILYSDKLENTTNLQNLSLGKRLCSYLIQNDLVKEYDVMKHNYSSSKMKLLMEKKNIVVANNYVPTLDTKCACFGVCIKNNTKKGYLESRSEDEVYTNTSIKRGTAQKESIATLTTFQDKGVVMSDLRIRKLTPKECWRLMGFEDSDYEKASQVTSKTQLYKQAGNSIVVNVLMAIFKQLL